MWYGSSSPPGGGGDTKRQIEVSFLCMDALVLTLSGGFHSVSEDYPCSLTILSGDGAQAGREEMTFRI